MKRSHSGGGRGRHMASNHGEENHRRGNSGDWVSGRDRDSPRDDYFSGDAGGNRGYADRSYRDRDDYYSGPPGPSEYRRGQSRTDIDYGFGSRGSGADRSQYESRSRPNEDRRGIEGGQYGYEGGYSGQGNYSHQSGYGGQRGMPNENDYGDIGGPDRMTNEGGYGSIGSQGGMNRQNFGGRGPKGYRRSDERIEEDVNEMLMYHPEIDATNIEVKVEDGEVTLSGSVNDRRTKRLAEDIVDQSNGVIEVHNHIRLQRSGGYDREVSRQTEADGHSSTSKSSKSSRGGDKSTSRSTGEDRNEASPGLQSKPAKDGRPGSGAMSEQENTGMKADQSP